MSLIYLSQNGLFDAYVIGPHPAKGLWTFKSRGGPDMEFVGATGKTPQKRTPAETLHVPDSHPQICKGTPPIRLLTIHVSFLE